MPSFFFINYAIGVLGVLGHGALGCSVLRGCKGTLLKPARASEVADAEK